MAFSTRRIGLAIIGLLILIYAVGVFWYVESYPEIGLRCMFTPVVQRVYPDYLYNVQPAIARDLTGSRVVRVGPHSIEIWPQYLRALLELEQETPVPVSDLAEAGSQSLIRLGDETLVRVELQREPDSPRTVIWCVLGHPPLDAVIPSIAWFFLQLGLFLVGALVFWKRPADRSAAQFFVLCTFTLGAYLGGYHWSKLITFAPLFTVYMVCAVLLPAVSLHFYLVFPRPKRLMESHPRGLLLAIYGVPLLFLVVLLGGYGYVRWLFRHGASPVELEPANRVLMAVTAVYLGVACGWFLASIAALLHSYRTASNVQERNQVKWILYGSLLAAVPIAYTLYLIKWQPDEFAGGAAIWPMFAASACFTIAFAISITRYRLMQLDQIVSSGAVYFLISFLAGLGYYGIVFLGMLVVGSQVISGPSFEQALWVSCVALVLMLVLDLVRSRVKKALDRRFYRDKFQLDKTLRRMGQTIEQLVDPPTLARRLLQTAAELLNASQGAVYLREGTPPLYRLAGSVGLPPPLEELAPGCPLVDAMRSRSTIVARAGSHDPAQGQLQFLGGALAQGVAHEGRLLALLVLGSKESGAYGGDDLNLLAAFAQMTALALENAEGHRTIEALNRDLQAKVEKIAEQQRRIMALQSQLQTVSSGQWLASPADDAKGAATTAPTATEEHLPEAPLSGIVGSSPAIRHLLQVVRKVSASQSAVLIRGESGTGKELLAQAVHDHSPRAGKPFVKVHCAALSPGLLESELFGHVKGAFTGAHRDKVGRFELANGGTLFLDEIGDISLEVQTKLLRVLQEMTFERVGSSSPVRVDVRLITATHQNLEELIRLGRFRDDLYYRLNVISLELPPLRQRREDIPELVQHFIRQHCERTGRPIPTVDDDALLALKSFSWPGNIRQLENVIERALVVADGPVISLDDLPPELHQPDGNEIGLGLIEPARSKDELVREIHAERLEREMQERERLVRALAKASGNKAEAARALGLARSTLFSRLKKYGLS